MSQVLRKKNKLWKIIDKEENKTSSYDLTKRDPQYTSADSVPLYELTLLKNHYHPTVVKFVDFILENYNKDVIKYEGDPLIDFSLINFLEKFMLKNARVKKEKHSKKDKSKDKETEFDLDENGEVIDLNKKDKDFELMKNEKGESFEFIKIFADKKSKDQEVTKSKKKKKSNVDDIDDVDADIDIEDYADKVMEKEYKKINFDKDIDDDISLGDSYMDDEEDDIGDKKLITKKKKKKDKKTETKSKSKGIKFKEPEVNEDLEGLDFEGGEDNSEDNYEDEFDDELDDDEYLNEEEPELEEDIY